MSVGPAEDAAGLRADLERSRATLLEAIARLTEADFGRELAPGLSVLGLLDRLGREERVAVAEARAAAGLPERPSGGARMPSEMPPQVIHDLAGARHETLRLLDELAVEGVSQAVPAVRSIVERESQAAARIHSARAAK
jgi:hypothetical protein